MNFQVLILGPKSPSSMADHSNKMPDMIAPPPYEQALLSTAPPPLSESSGNPCAHNSVNRCEAQFCVFAAPTLIFADDKLFATDFATADGLPVVSTPAVPSGPGQSYSYPAPQVASMGTGFAPPPGVGFGGGAVNPAYCPDVGAGSGAGVSSLGPTILMLGANQSGVPVEQMCNSPNQQVVQCPTCHNMVTTVTRASSPNKIVI